MILLTDELEPTMIGYEFTTVIALCRNDERDRLECTSSGSPTPYLCRPVVPRPSLAPTAAITSTSLRRRTAAPVVRAT